MTRGGLLIGARWLQRGVSALALVGCSASAASHRPADQVAAEPADNGAMQSGFQGAIGSNARYILKVGAMRNASGIRGEEMGRVLHQAVLLRARALDGAVVVEDDARLSAGGYEKHLPVVTLDGVVARLIESYPAGALQVQARVEFAIRREQVLKATLSGAATSYANGSSVSEGGRQRVQDQAVDGAVQSALRGATPALFLSGH